MSDDSPVPAPETAEERRVRSLAAVRALPALPPLYRCCCGLLLVTPSPCAECDSPAVRYVIGVRVARRPV